MSNMVYKITSHKTRVVTWSHSPTFDVHTSRGNFRLDMSWMSASRCSSAIELEADESQWDKKKQGAYRANHLEIF